MFTRVYQRVPILKVNFTIWKRPSRISDFMTPPMATRSRRRRASVCWECCVTVRLWESLGGQKWDELCWHLTWAGWTWGILGLCSNYLEDFGSISNRLLWRFLTSSTPLFLLGKRVMLDAASTRGCSFQATFWLEGLLSSKRIFALQEVLGTHRIIWGKPGCHKELWLLPFGDGLQHPLKWWFWAWLIIGVATLEIL